MNKTYYRDHWTEIEPERFERYKQMFEWSEATRPPLLEPARIQTGEIVVDLGCGPGLTAFELATWVGPAGHVHAVEGDWGFAFAEPVPDEDWRALIHAASMAFRTPGIGRRLYGYARTAGFTDVTVSVICPPDATGRLLPMVRNLCSYARQSGKLEEHKIDAVLNRCEEAALDQELLIVCPQFVVTGTR